MTFDGLVITPVPRAGVGWSWCAADGSEAE